MIAGLFNWLTGGGKSKNKEEFADDKFKAGQVWNYHARPGEENSTLTILKVEKYDHAGVVIHIYVSGLKLSNPHRPNAISEEVGHMPLSREAVANSVTTLVSTNAKLPDFEDGYANWKEAFDSGKGGVFSILVSEAVTYVERALNAGQQTRN